MARRDKSVEQSLVVGANRNRLDTAFYIIRHLPNKTSSSLIRHKLGNLIRHKLPNKIYARLPNKT